MKSNTRTISLKERGKSFINLVEDRKCTVRCAIATTFATGVLTTPTAFADVSPNTDIGSIVPKIVGIITQIFFYIGILLLAWSIGMLVLAFKNEDADSKSRAMLLLVVSAALIGIKPLLKGVLGSEYVD